MTGSSLGPNSTVVILENRKKTLTALKLAYETSTFMSFTKVKLMLKWVVSNAEKYYVNSVANDVC